MNAVEFFRSIGLLGVKSFLKNGNIRSPEMALELQRLVDSNELVGKLGGIEKAKTYVPDRYKSERLKQAIADVESVGVGCFK